MDCPFCQQQVPPGEASCPHCGQPLPAPVPAPEPQPVPAGPAVDVIQKVGLVEANAGVVGAILHGVQKAAVTVQQSVAVLGQDVIADRRDRALLLTRVKHAWSEGALAKKEEVHARLSGGSGLLSLPRRLVPGEVGGPSAARREIDYLERRDPDPEEGALLPERDILELFEALGRSLLILGEPGAGKMTTLLQLVRAAAGRAEQEPDAPVPVVLHLLSWENGRADLAEWIPAEMNTEYQVHKADARRWLDNNYLWLLLYGLDEVNLAYRDDCIRAINAFVQDHGLTGIAVCCHGEQYTEANVKLKLSSALRLESLTPAQIDAYFDGAGPKLVGLRQEMAADASLGKLLARPLWLNVLSLTYEDQPPAQATTAGQGRTWAAYVERMLRYKMGEDKPYADAQTIHWLAWLAQRMKEHGQHAFAIERMQPAWLPSPREHWAYMLASRLLVALYGGVLGGLIIGIASRLTEGWSLAEALRQGVVRGLVEGLLGGLAAAVTVAVVDMVWIRVVNRRADGAGSPFRRSLVKILVIMAVVGLIVVVLFGLILGTTRWLGLGPDWWLQEGLAIGLIYGLSAGFLFGFGAKGVRQSLDDDIQPVEHIRWSRPGAVVGGLQGLLLGLIAGPIAGVVAQWTAFVAPWVERGLQRGWVVLATAGVSMLFLALVGALFGGLVGTLPIPKKIVPNQGLRQSIINAAGTGPVVGLVIGGLGFLAGYLAGGAGSRGLLFGITWALYGLFFGVLASLWYGGVFAAQHAVLRLLLWFRGDLPRPGKLVAFLDYAAQRVFLEKVGGSYRWIHKYLQDYFAALDVPPGDQGSERPGAG